MILACKNKNTKCPIDAHCHRHCRKDLRITEDYLEFNMNSEIRFYKFGFRNKISEIRIQKSEIRIQNSEFKNKNSEIKKSEFSIPNSQIRIHKSEFTIRFQK